MSDTPTRRPRRLFTDQFKAGAVRLVLDEGKTVGAAARDLDLTKTALREWVRRTQADRTKGRTGLTTAERDELARLRKENRELRTERDILENESRAQGRPHLWARTPWRTLTRPGAASPASTVESVFYEQFARRRHRFVEEHREPA